jgi:DNA-binding transcriptional ArsR family regulator
LTHCSVTAAASAPMSISGVCVLFIADKLGVAQPTATAHLQALACAGLVTSKRMAGWTFYKRDEKAIAALKREIRREL